MSAAVLATLLVPVAVALLPLGATLRAGQPSAPPLVLRLALAAGLGLGLGSCAFFLALVLFDGTRMGTAALDVAVGLVLAGVWWVYRPAGEAATVVSASRWSTLDVGLAVACAIAAAAFIGLFAAEVYTRPHGEIDAWTSWNTKARFLAEGGIWWRLPFEDFSRHRDYPLLLPGAVAHGWRYAGVTDQAMPIGIAFLFTAATVVLLLGALCALRGRTVGLLGALCLLASPGFARRAAWLYADVPLAYYMLAALVLLAYWERAQSGWVTGPAREMGTILPAIGQTVGASFQSPEQARSAALVWAGLAGGLAAWTKREGLLFLAALVAVRLAASIGDRRRLRGLGWLALGTAPPLALLVLLRTLVASRNVTGGRSIDEVIARLADPSRYADIAAAVWRLLSGSPSGWLVLALPAFVLLMGRTADPGARASAGRAAAVVVLLAAMYAGIFLTTPAPLVWHLQTALDRLSFQLWPSTILALLLWTASPEERW